MRKNARPASGTTGNRLDGFVDSIALALLNIDWTDRDADDERRRLRMFREHRSEVSRERQHQTPRQHQPAPDVEFGAGWDACIASLGRPAAQEVSVLTRLRACPNARGTGNLEKCINVNWLTT